MTIYEARIERDKLALSIKQALEDFETRTGLSVADIKVVRRDNGSSEISYGVDVNIKL